MKTKNKKNRKPGHHTKAKSISVLLLALIVSGYSCNSPVPGNIPPNDPSQEGKPIAMAVLCDFSTLGADGVERIASFAAQIVKKVPHGSRLSFFPIESNTFMPEIFQFRKKDSPDRVSSEFAMREEISEMADSVQKCLLRYNTRSNENLPNTKPRSCIWSSVKARMPWFDGYTDGYCRQLLILSDMIEECNDSPIGPLFMQKRRFDPESNKEFKQYSDTSFTKYQDVKIRCISTTSSYNLEEKGFLSTNLVRETWKQIFSKMGYRNPIDYESSLPENLSTGCISYHEE